MTAFSPLRRARRAGNSLRVAQTEQPYLGRDSATPYPRREILLRCVWAVVQGTLFRWSPRPLHGFRARLLTLFGAQISEPSRVVVFPSVKIIFPWNLTMAAGSMIGRNVTVYNLARITLERGANVSQNCHLCAGTHDYLQWSMPLVRKPIVLGENSWLAADVFVGPGVTVGELCVVGARSVVVKDLPARMVCAGNPCRPIKPRGEPV
ncbi:MAG: transferase hexapeptide repeat containing protein [Verrucomicrobia bacterium]|nr:transferase hexapeptide repeat containing protein [Verrucomicrobiota bacterium]